MDISTSDLRTLLAGMAMQGLLANPKNNLIDLHGDSFKQGSVQTIITDTAINQADSLMKNLNFGGE